MIIIFIIIAIPVGKIIIEKNYLDELNRNINVGSLQLLTTIEGNIEKNSNYIEDGGFGARYFYQIDGEFSFVYSGYPDVLDSYRLTEIHVKSMNHSIFGTTIGNESVDVQNAMNSFGYKQSTHGPDFHGSSQSYIYFIKGKIGITYYLKENNIVESILIRLETTNKDNVVF